MEYSIRNKEESAFPILSSPRKIKRMIITQLSFDSAGQAYQQTRISHWDSIAKKRDHWSGAGTSYHRRLAEIYRFHVNPNMRVLEIGCADGRLLAALRPAYGLGV